MLWLGHVGMIEAIMGAWTLYRHLPIFYMMDEEEIVRIWAGFNLL